MTDKVWLKHYPDYISENVDIDEMPLQQFLTNAAKRTPDKIAIHFMGKDISYSELYQNALKFANYLKKLGIEKGDRVAIMLPNIPQTVITYYGVLYAGAVVVMTNPLYTEREIEYQLKDAGAKVIISLDILYPRIMKVFKNTNLENIIITGVKDFLPFPKNKLYPMVQKKEYGFKVTVEHSGVSHLLTEIFKSTKALEMEVDDDFDFENDIALLQYTGGTTGFPKGVMLTHKNLVANVAMCDVWLTDNNSSEDKILGVLPFFHVYGMTTVLLLTVRKSNTMVLLPKFDPETTLKTIQKQRPTLFPGAPTIYIGLINYPDIEKYDLSSIKACISGSASLPADVQKKFEEITGGKLVEGYGLTESSPVTHANLVFEDLRRKNSIGIPWPNTDAKIIDSNSGQDIANGEIGELVVKGPQIMKGYWNLQEETDIVLSDGWLKTGDLGYMDEDGFFYIVDRKKDIIIAGGYNIYPREVEEVLYEHPDIVECVAVGVPDPYRGETVKAFVVLHEGSTVTEKELNTFCREHLASYKVPRIYEFRTELPKTAVGKILRRTLVDEEKKKQQA